jgi:hypothetical protein
MGCLCVRLLCVRLLCVRLLCVRLLCVRLLCVRLLARLQSRKAGVAFGRWVLFKKVQRRLKAHNRRELMLRFKEWRALGAWRFRLRTAAVDIQRITRGRQTRKFTKKMLALHRHQMVVVNKVGGCSSRV